MITAEYNNTKKDMNRILKDEKTIKAIQRDIWRAHKRAMDQDLDDWSEQAMMGGTPSRPARMSPDAIWTATDYDVFWDEMVHNSNLAQDGSRDTLGETDGEAASTAGSKARGRLPPHDSDDGAQQNYETRAGARRQRPQRTPRSWYSGCGKDAPPTPKTTTTPS